MSALDVAPYAIWSLVSCACVWAVVIFVQQLRRKRAWLRREAAAKRAAALAAAIPQHPYVGASRDRSRPGKARRAARRHV